MEIAVCVKRVPQVGGRIVVTPDGQDVDTRMSGFAISPHEECAVDEAVRLAGQFGLTVDLCVRDHRITEVTDLAARERDRIMRGTALEVYSRAWESR